METWVLTFGVADKHFWVTKVCQIVTNNGHVVASDCNFVDDRRTLVENHFSVLLGTSPVVFGGELSNIARRVGERTIRAVERIIPANRRTIGV